VHGANINLLLPEDKVFPDVEVLVNNELLVLLPSKEKGIEIGIAGGVFSLNIIPPSPDIVVIPLERNVRWLTSADLLLLLKILDW